MHSRASQNVVNAKEGKFLHLQLVDPQVLQLGNYIDNSQALTIILVYSVLV